MDVRKIGVIFLPPDIEISEIFGILKKVNEFDKIIGHGAYKRFENVLEIYFPQKVLRIYDGIIYEDWATVKHDRGFRRIRGTEVGVFGVNFGVNNNAIVILDCSKLDTSAYDRILNTILNYLNYDK